MSTGRGERIFKQMSYIQTVYVIRLTDLLLSIGARVNTPEDRDMSE